jgi:hypothetical protein
MAVPRHSSRAQRISFSEYAWKRKQNQMKNRERKEAGKSGNCKARNCKPSQLLPTTHTTFLRKDWEIVDPKSSSDGNREVR